MTLSGMCGRSRAARRWISRELSISIEKSVPSFFFFFFGVLFFTFFSCCGGLGGGGGRGLGGVAVLVYGMELE